VEDNVPLSGLNAVHADRVLLDTFVKDARGGTGKSFDWRSLERAGGDEFDRSRIILAGGIDADNARRASKLGCFAIDVNSGVEILGSPGKKDRRKIENLFARLRGEV
jgi:indole-3-glycerol phosphate synthase/phosphoribosylanthranilate isomerase